MFTRPLSFLFLLLCLYSCQKAETQPDSPPTPDESSWKTEMYTLPREIIVTNDAAQSSRYSLEFDSIQNTLELREIYDDSKTSLRLRFKYDNNGYLIEQASQLRGYTSLQTWLVNRDADNKIVWVTDNTTTTLYDTVYFVYSALGSGMKITELQVTGFDRNDPSQSPYDTLHTTYDASNKVMKRQLGQQLMGEILDYSELYNYDDIGRLLDIAIKSVRYDRGTYPHTQIDSFGVERKLTYSSYAPVVTPRKSINEIAFGRDYYLFTTGSLVTTFIYHLSMPLLTPRDGSSPLPMHLPLNVVNYYRPVEFYAYNSLAGQHYPPSIYLTYEDDSNGKLAKIKSAKSGWNSTTYEFKY